MYFNHQCFVKLWRLLSLPSPGLLRRVSLSRSHPAVESRSSQPVQPSEMLHLLCSCSPMRSAPPPLQQVTSVGSKVSELGPLFVCLVKSESSSLINSTTSQTFQPAGGCRAFLVTSLSVSCSASTADTSISAPVGRDPLCAQ